jgi:hypothetical protein
MGDGGRELLYHGDTEDTENDNSHYLGELRSPLVTVSGELSFPQVLPL